jgi:hypothetical protein
MRFIFLTLMTAILVVFLNPVVPFWVVMISIGILSAAIYPNGIGGFLGGGLGMGLAWMGQSIFLSITSASALPDRMGELMGLGSGMTLVAATAVVGFLLGGFSGWTGVLFRNVLQKSPKNVYKG